MLDVEIEHPVVAPTIDVPIAIQASVKAVLTNPFTMALWGLIVATSLAVGFLLVFAGLAVVVPVLRIRPGISTARSWNRRRAGEALPGRWDIGTAPKIATLGARQGHHPDVDDLATSPLRLANQGQRCNSSSCAKDGALQTGVAPG